MYWKFFNHLRIHLLVKEYKLQNKQFLSWAEPNEEQLSGMQILLENLYELLDTHDTRVNDYLAQTRTKILCCENNLTGCCFNELKAFISHKRRHAVSEWVYPMACFGSYIEDPILSNTKDREEFGRCVEFELSYHSDPISQSSWMHIEEP